MPLLAWLGAVVIAAVVLGFCAHEIIWRARRLQGDLRQLQADSARLAQLQDHVAAAQRRLARTGAR
jgi:outer membrane murein-binding lipoprotein Lpp